MVLTKYQLKENGIEDEKAIDTSSTLHYVSNAVSPAFSVFDTR